MEKEIVDKMNSIGPTAFCAAMERARAYWNMAGYKGSPRIQDLYDIAKSLGYFGRE